MEHFRLVIIIIIYMHVFQLVCILFTTRIYNPQRLGMLILRSAIFGLNDMWFGDDCGHFLDHYRVPVMPLIPNMLFYVLIFLCLQTTYVFNIHMYVEKTRGNLVASENGKKSLLMIINE